MSDPRVPGRTGVALRQLEQLAERLGDDRDRAMVQELLDTFSELDLTRIEELRARNAELRMTQQQADRERARYQDLFDLAPEAYLVTDADGVVTDANLQAHELLGTLGSSLQGTPIAAVVAPESRGDLLRVLRWLGQGYGMHGWELRLVEGAEAASVLASVEPVPAIDGGTELRWVLSDATATMLARQRLSDLLLAAQLDASELRVVSGWQATLLGSAAHDLRAPLAAIGDALEAAIDRPSAMADPDLRALLVTAATLAVKLRRLLPGLLDLGRLQANDVVARRGTVDLGRMVDHVRGLLGVTTDRVTADLEVVEIEADQVQLERIIENLVENALHHTPLDAAVRISTTAHGVDVLLSVDDAGVGVADDRRERIFSPFSQVDDGRGDGAAGTEGTGLGLALVAMFAAMHGGRAWVEPSDLGGASFRVLLSAALADED